MNWYEPATSMGSIKPSSSNHAFRFLSGCLASRMSHGMSFVHVLVLSSKLARNWKWQPRDHLYLT